MEFKYLVENISYLVHQSIFNGGWDFQLLKTLHYQVDLFFNWNRNLNYITVYRCSILTSFQKKAFLSKKGFHCRRRWGWES